MQTRDDSDRGKSAISPCIRGIRCSMSAGIRELSQSLGEFQLRKPSHSPSPSSSSSSSSLLVGGIVISRAEKTTRLFFTDVVSFPSPKRTDPPTDRKQRIDTFDAFASCALDFSRPLIEGGSALTRSIWNEEWKLGVQTVSFGQTNSFFPAVSAGEEATIESGIFSTSLHSYNRHSRFYHCYTYICIDSCYIVGTRLVTILNDRYECKGLN